MPFDSAHGWLPQIIVHAALALACLLLGAMILLRRKGTTVHRVLGWIWVSAMMVVAILSFWIRTSGGFSLIHVLSVVTPIFLVRGVYRARTHQVAGHRRTMLGLFVGALLVAGLFTLMPYRLIGHLVWGMPGTIHVPAASAEGSHPP